jgi:hypothetical protein
MFVSVIHRISDPDRFFEIARSSVIPDDLRLPLSVSNADRSTTVCLWEAPSVQSVRDFLEPLAARVCKNEYAEVEPSLSLGLPATTLA